MFSVCTDLQLHQGDLTSRLLLLVHLTPPWPLKTKKQKPQNCRYLEVKAVVTTLQAPSHQWQFLLAWVQLDSQGARDQGALLAVPCPISVPAARHQSLQPLLTSTFFFLSILNDTIFKYANVTFYSTEYYKRDLSWQRSFFGK